MEWLNQSNNLTTKRALYRRTLQYELVGKFKPSERLCKGMGNRFIGKENYWKNVLYMVTSAEQYLCKRKRET